MTTTKTMRDLLHDYTRINEQVNELCDTRDVFLSFGRVTRDRMEVAVMAGLRTRPLDVKTVAKALCEQAGYRIQREVSEWEIRLVWENPSAGW